jgi:hypothetical protein
MHMYFYLPAGQADLTRAGEVLKAIASQVPSNQAGGRFKRLFSASKKAKTHHYFMLAGPYGSMLTANLTDMPEAQRLTYMRMFQVCGDLWAKSISKHRIQELQLAVVECICLMELHLPATEADVKLHDLLHLAFDVLPNYGNK